MKWLSASISGQRRQLKFKGPTVANKGKWKQWRAGGEDERETRQAVSGRKAARSLANSLPLARTQSLSGSPSSSCRSSRSDRT